LKDNNYGRFIDFLVQISKPSYFTLLYLAEFLKCISSFSFRSLMGQPECAPI